MTTRLLPALSHIQPGAAPQSSSVFLDPEQAVESSCPLVVHSASSKPHSEPSRAGVPGHRTAHHKPRQLTAHFSRSSFLSPHVRVCTYDLGRKSYQQSLFSTTRLSPTLVTTYCNYLLTCLIYHETVEFQNPRIQYHLPSHLEHLQYRRSQKLSKGKEIRREGRRGTLLNSRKTARCGGGFK